MYALRTIVSLLLLSTAFFSPVAMADDGEGQCESCLRIVVYCDQVDGFGDPETLATSTVGEAIQRCPGVSVKESDANCLLTAPVEPCFYQDSNGSIGVGVMVRVNVPKDACKPNDCSGVYVELDDQGCYTLVVENAGAPDHRYPINCQSPLM